MQKESILLVLGLGGATTLLASGGRMLTRTHVNWLEARLFLMEMFATFQLCAGISLLHLLIDVDPKPQFYLAHIYAFTILHFLLTLAENISNPACTLLYILRRGVSMRLGGLKIVAQFVGATVARLYVDGIYLLGISRFFSDPKHCGNPLQAALFKAFVIELLASIMFQLTLLESQRQEVRFRANVLAIAITSLVYAGISTLFAMAISEAFISLIVMVGTMVVTAYCRQLTQQFMSHKRHIHCFFLELTGAFQICACTHELILLADLPPKPHMALALTYVFTALHGMTLPGSINNPSSSFQQLSKGRIMVKTWWLQTSAQFTGAVLANIYIKSIWILGITLVHSRALTEHCGRPIQTTIANAFLLELLFSFLLHLTLLQFESMNPKTKVHLVALLITTLVYEGGHLTGAIFNPALAFSLHMNCFLGEFWNYVLVYWVAPCIGSALVVVVWDEVLPQLHIRA